MSIPYTLKKIDWKLSALLIVLLCSDIAVHPLGFGPDRLIHDPAVYQLASSQYLSTDWYTSMATKSGVYLFYGKMVNSWSFFGIWEQLWRSILYICSLLVLYYALIRIARLFSKNIFIVPIISVFHMLLLANGRSPWLYGPFMQIDGGLAPRSIGIALSFLALFFLLKNRILLSSAVLGIATLFHVSNSLIIFTLFFIVWLYTSWIYHKSFPYRKAALSIATYILCGGFFAIYITSLGVGGGSTLSTELFIWTWVYLRAPYFALPLIPWIWWLLLLLHSIAILVGWFLLRKVLYKTARQSLDILALIGIGSVLYFFLFYLFTFITPWLPGFQFYSIRVIYLAYFVAYLFMGLLIVYMYKRSLTYIVQTLGLRGSWEFPVALLLCTLVLAVLPFHASSKNLHTSFTYLMHTEEQDNSYGTIFAYVSSHPEPFLAPVDWNTTSIYLPTVVSFKSFGFTKQGIAEWFARMNDMSRGELLKLYQAQRVAGHFEPVSLNWGALYGQLTPSDITNLSEKYTFRLFVADKKQTYPFMVITEDDSYRLYQVR